jgi:sugar phosphate permease
MATDQNHTPATAVRHLVVFAITLTSLLLYLDRNCIAFLTRFIEEDLQLTDSQMAWVLGGFFWTYAIAQVPCGWLTDRLGGRVTMTWFVLLWSLFTALTGLTGGLVPLFLLRLGFGLAQAGAYPTSAAMIGKWMPLSSRGIANSVVAFGGRVGGAVASVLTAYLLMLLVPTWRGVMLIYGAAGLFVAALFWWVARNRPDEHSGCNAAEIARIEAGARRTDPYGKARTFPWREVLASRSLWLDNIAEFGTNVGWVFLVTWLPRYLQEAHEVPVELRGWLTGLPLVAGWFGMLGGGWLTDRLTPILGLRWGRALPMSVSRFIAMGAFLACLLPLSPWGVTAAFAVVAFATDLGIGALWAFKQDVGGRHVGSILGWGNMWGNFGAAVSPVLLNSMVGESKHWDGAFLACAGAFLIAGLAAIGIDARIPVVPEETEDAARGEDGVEE